MSHESKVHTLAVTQSGLNPVVAVVGKARLRQVDFHATHFRHLFLYDKATAPVEADMPKMVVRLEAGKNSVSYESVTFANGIAYMIGNLTALGAISTPGFPSVTCLNVVYDDLPPIGTPDVREAKGFTDGFGYFTAVFNPPLPHTPHVDISFTNSSLQYVARLTAATGSGCTVKIEQRTLVDVIGNSVLTGTGTPAQNKEVSIRAY